jgi:hypothetical protein
MADDVESRCWQRIFRLRWRGVLAKWWIDAREGRRIEQKF